MVKRKLLSQQGVTLTELLVSMILVGVVMAGVISADIGFRRINQRLTNETTAALELMPIMNHVLKRALYAQGDATDFGFCIDGHAVVPDCPGTTYYTFCVRETDASTFYCYSQSGTKLYACSLGAFGECDTNDFHIGDVSATGFSGNAANPDYDNTTNVFSIELVPVDAALADSVSGAVSPPGHQI